MRPENLNCFLEAAVEVVEKVLKIDVTVGAIERYDDIGLKGSIGITIGVEGDLNGAVIFIFSKKTAMAVASGMFKGMNITKITDEVNGALCELCNMITGNATGKLLNDTIKCNITPPTVTAGEDATISMPGVKKPFMFPLKVKAGVIEMNILLKDDRTV
jgi:chemotaxis protein CheX